MPSKFGAQGAGLAGSVILTGAERHCFGLSRSETDAITSLEKPQLLHPPSTTKRRPVFSTDFTIKSGLKGFKTRTSIKSHVPLPLSIVQWRSGQVKSSNRSLQL